MILFPPAALSIRLGSWDWQPFVAGAEVLGNASSIAHGLKDLAVDLAIRAYRASRCPIYPQEFETPSCIAAEICQPAKSVLVAGISRALLYH